MKACVTQPLDVWYLKGRSWLQVTAFIKDIEKMFNYAAITFKLVSVEGTDPLHFEVMHHTRQKAYATYISPQ